jgi:hypothetical protein
MGGMGASSGGGASGSGGGASVSGGSGGGDVSGSSGDGGGNVGNTGGSSGMDGIGVPGKCGTPAVPCSKNTDCGDIGCYVEGSCSTTGMCSFNRAVDGTMCMQGLFVGACNAGCCSPL